MLKTLQSKKQPFGAIKSRIFNSLKIRIFQKAHAFFLYLLLVKTRLEIILNAFVEKKETFFAYNNKKFFEVPKIAFSKGVNPCFGKKMPFFCLCRFREIWT